jgi:hypothetical protein
MFTAHLIETLPVGRTLCDAVGAAQDLAQRKHMGVYVMRDVRAGSGFRAELFCDHCPSAVVGIVQPDGSYFSC